MSLETAHEIVWVDIDSLVLNPDNTNKHPEDQIERLAKIIEYQGWRWPILVWKEKGIVAAGEGRYLAAKKLGLKQVPVSYQSFESEDQFRAFVTSDNAIASWAELDFSLINTQVGDFDPEFDIDLLGIKNFEIEVADKHEDKDADAVPENVETRCKPGDLWILGNHRLLCGDSTNIQHVERLMNGKKADMVFTDPPYNLQQRGQTKRTNATKTKREDFGDWDIDFDPLQVLPFLKDFSSENSHLFVCTSNYLFGEIHKYFEDEQMKPNYLVWCKNNPAPSLAKNRFVQATELIVHAIKGKPQFKYPAGSNLKNWFDGRVEKHEFGHPSQKPIYMIDNFMNPTEGSVLDLFGGSGSTLIACEKTNRKCFMMELDPHYCDVILKRWEDFTGKEAQLEPNG